ncbi:VOC family protein [Pseudomonas oryzihabitans]|uniref:2-oxoadipate dioxygenase/decarboxylase HglS n=1 Tax=Pseudomonas oryzihabitans TaxID=47885 RepID=UPI00165E09BA|nr:MULTISPECIES: VOC family protein [Pseudomonas]MDK8262925.1 VOC family protein [Pseudomonas oryzihabitans]QNQ97376.1 DUF1338 domain-containing protein [Pseudomonas psychrotolerans]
MTAASLLSPDLIRTRFSQAMSAMYRQEVPQYGTLLELVAEVNAGQPGFAGDSAERLDLERHGAIRVGTAAELATLRRLFAVMGMRPVGYYDLSVAGVPVHSTAFRPVEPAALQINPFRVFTSLLRLELIEDAELRQLAERVLNERRIFTPGALELIERAEAQGGLTDAEADAFVQEALETFRWHREANVDASLYQRLHDAHRLIADVVCFKGPHINHLTPRTLDIDAVQARMPARGIAPKETIEGPPRRQCPILLRQTSFKALEEPILFQGEVQGSHTARFGEIEQRGIALTPAGRQRYDELLQEVRQRSKVAGSDYATVLAEVFQALPDNWDELRRQGLAWFRYRAVAGSQAASDSRDPEALIAAGQLLADPITYEDFLPVSAAGIFQSNLGAGSQQEYQSGGNRAAFEAALGAPVLDEMALYERQQQESLDTALAALGRPA